MVDVFTKFISTSSKDYNLDPCHYFSAPGLSWDAMLKMTKTELETISDHDKYIFIEKGMRGGISSISKRLVNQIMNIAQTMTVKILKHILYTLT